GGQIGVLPCQAGAGGGGLGQGGEGGALVGGVRGAEQLGGDLGAQLEQVGLGEGDPRPLREPGDLGVQAGGVLLDVGPVLQGGAECVRAGHSGAVQPAQRGAQVLGDEPAAGGPVLAADVAVGAAEGVESRRCGHGAASGGSGRPAT